LKAGPESIAAADRIAAAVRVLREGGVIIFPTSGLYGLGADALNPAAVKQVFRIKQRAPDKPLPVLAPDMAAVNRIVRAVTPAAQCLMDAFWPGGLTLVLEAADGLPEDLTAATGKIGVRIPNHSTAVRIVTAFGGIVTATSANISGQKGCRRVDDIDPFLCRSSALVIDGGPLHGRSSTVVDATSDPPAVLREGAIPAAAILDALG